MQPVEEPAEEVKEDEEGASRQIRRSPRLRRDAARCVHGALCQDYAEM